MTQQKISDFQNCRSISAIVVLPCNKILQIIKFVDVETSTCVIQTPGNEIKFQPYLHKLPFHFPTTQQHGACEEDGCRRRLGPSS
jgi:hypothetical protein